MKSLPSILALTSKGIEKEFNKLLASPDYHYLLTDYLRWPRRGIKEKKCYLLYVATHDIVLSVRLAYESRKLKVKLAK